MLQQIKGVDSTREGIAGEGHIFSVTGKDRQPPVLLYCQLHEQWPFSLDQSFPRGCSAPAGASMDKGAL